ncbi:MAG: STT3 domain-containing protein, partial [Candidatus Thorarchaeota archaeon]
FTMLVMGRYSKRLLSTSMLTISLGIFIGGLIPRNGFGNLTDFAILAPIGVVGLMVFYEIWLRIRGYRETTASKLAPHMKPILVGLIAPLVGKFLTVINPFTRLDQRILASVAEHLPAPWGSFYNTLLILVFFFPLGMYFAFKRGRDEDWFILLYGLTSVYFAGSMIRLTLILAPGVAILAAVASYNILSPYAKVITQKSVFERRRFRMSTSLTSEHALTAFAFVGLLLSVNLILGVQYVSFQVGNPEFAQAHLSATSQATDWQTAAVVASWWDYGYWINSASDAKTIVDNATFNSTQIALMGYAMMSLNITDSLKTFNLWNTTHVLVYFGHRYQGFGGDEGKWPWMVRIAEDKLGSNVIDDATYLSSSDQTLPAFYESTIYKLMSYGEPTTSEEANALGLSQERIGLDQVLWQDTEWIARMPIDLHGAFSEPYFSSTFGTVKIYEIDYTMYYQWLNKTQSDWQPQFVGDNLGMILDGGINGSELSLTSYPVSFGGGYEATVYTESNTTHMYYGIQMDNYTLGDDAFGIQISPVDSAGDSDLRIVNYNGQDFDGHIRFDGTWTEDSTGTNSSEFATGDGVIEFVVPLNGGDPQDVSMTPGMNYQIKLLWWNNVDHGEPSFTMDWTTFWVPVELF